MQNIRSADDGYTKAGYIAQKEGFWNALRFKFRPATHAERTAYEDGIRDSKGAAASRVVCVAIAKHVESWDEVDAAGKPLPITADIVGRFENPYLVDRLYNIIRGWECSDPDPAAAVSAEALVQSLLENVPVGIIEEEHARKN